MATMIARTCAAGTAALALALLGGGVASAADQAPQPSPSPSVWVVPGLDTGALLGLTTQVPAQALAPVDGVLTALGG